MYKTIHDYEKLFSTCCEGSPHFWCERSWIKSADMSDGLFWLTSREIRRVTGPISFIISARFILAPIGTAFEETLTALKRCFVHSRAVFNEVYWILLQAKRLLSLTDNRARVEYNLKVWKAACAPKDEETRLTYETHSTELLHWFSHTNVHEWKSETNNACHKDEENTRRKSAEVLQETSGLFHKYEKTRLTSEPYSTEYCIGDFIFHHRSEQVRQMPRALTHSFFFLLIEILCGILHV